MTDKPIGQLILEARQILLESWQNICLRAAQGDLPNVVAEEELLEAIQRSVRSSIKSYRYVLPTQLVAKLADTTVDCRALQKKYSGSGAFDARSIAHMVIVPFDAEHHDVLGGAPEPYVNKPLRFPGVTPQFAEAQRNRAGWSDLCLVLDAVESRSDPEFTRRLFMQVLTEIQRRLAEVDVVYPVPIRISMDRMISLLESFMVESSGGDRAQAVAAGLFQLIGERFHLFDDVRREVTNAADAASGQIADLECLAAGEIVLAVEVKDKQLSIADVESTLQNARTKEVSEVLFIAQRGFKEAELSDVPNCLENKFASGQNVYLTDIGVLARTVLALMGEDARPVLLRLIGQQLDRFRSDIRHKRAWRNLLAAV